MKNVSFKLGTIYIILIFLFTSLTIAVHYIPKSSIIHNVESSAEILEEEGVYKDLFNVWLFKLDNYTDALMIHIAALADDDDPVKAAMLNIRTDSPEHGPIESTLDFIKGDKSKENISSYGRYWHGNQIFLRPLLTFLDYSGIRTLNYVTFIILISLCFILIYKKISLNTGLLFIASLLMINFPMVPLSMQFSTCFYIALISIIIILVYEKIRNSITHLFLAFFVIGSCTSFFDLLTTPQITLGLPLIFYCLTYNDHKLKTLILACLAWAMGYAIMWASKWVMVSVFTDFDIFENAISSARLRSSNSLENQDISIISFLCENPPFLIASVFYILCLLGSGFMLLQKKTKRLLQENGYLLLISLIVPVWYIFMLNHSVEHCWFTWRASIVTLLSMLIFVYNIFKNYSIVWKRK